MSINSTGRALGGREIEFEFNRSDGSESAIDGLNISEYFESILRALAAVAKHIDQSKGELRYDLVSLRYNSPLRVVFEGHSNSGELSKIAETHEFFSSAIASIQDNGDLPPLMDRPLLNALHRVGEASKRSGLVASIRTHRGNGVAIRPQLADSLSHILDQEEVIHGSAEGTIELLDIGEKQRVRIQPIVGPALEGRFRRHLTSKIRSAVGEYVVATGTLVYRVGELHPHQLKIDDFRVVDEGDPPPTFEDLWGVWRRFRPDLSSKDLIEEMWRGWK